MTDNGIGLTKGTDLRKVDSIGLQTMFTLIEHQLNGSVNCEVNNGLQWHIKINDKLNKESV